MPVSTVEYAGCFERMLDAVEASSLGEGSPSQTKSPSLTLREGVWRLYRPLSGRRRAQLVGLIALSVIGAIAELGAIGAVFPFLALLANPALATHYSFLRSALAIFG